MGTPWVSGIKRAARDRPELPMTSKPACTCCTYCKSTWAGDSEVASACAWATTLCPCRKVTARST